MGSIRGGTAAAEAVAEAVAEVVAAIVWFIGCGRSAKGRRDRLFLFSYIYRVRKVVSQKRVNKELTLQEVQVLYGAPRRFIVKSAEKLYYLQVVQNIQSEGI